MAVLGRVVALLLAAVTFQTPPAHSQRSVPIAPRHLHVQQAHLPFPIHSNVPSPSYEQSERPLFPLLPFHKHPRNPILRPNPFNSWESFSSFNPTALVLNNTIFLFYRAQNAKLTSSIGLAWSTDGTTFHKLLYPVIYPTEPWEFGGGTEDPRVVRVNGTVYVTYTGFEWRPETNTVVGQLCLAYSRDLLHWTKLPPLFPGWMDVAYDAIGRPIARVNHTKSAAIVDEPTRDGRYHMYFGDSFIYHATSRNLLSWIPDPAESYFGPAPIKARDGKWIFFYNGASNGNAAGYPQGHYSVGQMLVDPTRSYQFAPLNGTAAENGSVEVGAGGFDPRYQPALTDGPVARLERPLLVPEAPDEQVGQVPNVVFAEGIVRFKGRWWLYYGQADKTVGVATSEVQD
ncbi:MAG: hypothetical protein M1831_000096 [Alyxoria varia]|nr:MAG: hypothetical protein M1831_000096 [Alyxoria varia]